MTDRKPPVFGPEDLTLIYAAFDEAWETVKVNHSGDLQTTEVARHRLANAVMSAYRNGVTDREALKAADRHYAAMGVKRRRSGTSIHRAEIASAELPVIRRALTVELAIVGTLRLGVWRWFVAEI